MERFLDLGSDEQDPRAQDGTHEHEQRWRNFMRRWREDSEERPPRPVLDSDGRWRRGGNLDWRRRAEMRHSEDRSDRGYERERSPHVYVRGERLSRHHEDRSSRARHLTPNTKRLLREFARDLMDEFDRREERKERKERKRAAKEERKRRRAQARDDHASHKRRSDEHDGSDSDDAAAGQGTAKTTNDDVAKPKLFNDCLQKHWWDEKNRVRCGFYNTNRPNNFPARFTGEVDEFVYVQVPSTYVGMQRYEPGKVVKTTAENIYEVVIRDGIRVFASKDQLRRRIVYNNLVEAYDDFPFEVLAEATDTREEHAGPDDDMPVDTPSQPSFWLVTVYRKYVVVNSGTSDDWFDLSREDE
ncbi:hypothetical protein AAVH_25715 [Aphelenchoides avenae]|nr:hypothetical protein AAVH_25715 [Aphelenchus avenae]